MYASPPERSLSTFWSQLLTHGPHSFACGSACSAPASAIKLHAGSCASCPAVHIAEQMVWGVQAQSAYEDPKGYGQSTYESAAKKTEDALGGTGTGSKSAGDGLTDSAKGTYDSAASSVGGTAEKADKELGSGTVRFVPHTLQGRLPYSCASSCHKCPSSWRQGHPPLRSQLCGRHR